MKTKFILIDYENVHTFSSADLSVLKRDGFNSINWFAHCGKRLALDLTMETEQIRGWTQALESCKASTWETAQLSWC